MSEPPFQRVALIGLGLIAGSMAHAMRQKGLAREITGYARSAETRATAAEIEELGEMVRARVLAHSSVGLEWEIKRMGEFAQ